MAPACPRCQAALVPHADGRLRLDACPVRHGLFVRAGELRRAVPMAAHAALEESLARAPSGDAACPACGARMRVLAVARHGDAIDVDACPACQGCWFDEGELERVRRAPPKDAGSAASTARVPEGAKGFSVASALAADASSGALWAFLELLGSLVSDL